MSGPPDVRKSTGDARLGAMLREMRRQDRRGLKEVAHACDISVSALSNIESGRSMPSIPVFARLCAHYGVEPGRLIRHLAA